MEIDWAIVIFTLLLIDSLGAVLMSWFGRGWWSVAIGHFEKYFPPAKGWTALYLALVLVIGYLLGIFS